MLFSSLNNIIHFWICMFFIFSTNISQEQLHSLLFNFAGCWWWEWYYCISDGHQGCWLLWEPYKFFIFFIFSCHTRLLCLHQVSYMNSICMWRVFRFSLTSYAFIGWRDHFASNAESTYSSKKWAQTCSRWASLSIEWHAIL